MPKFIKTIVDRVQLANRKGLCPYYSPDQLEDEVHAESLNLWKKYIKEFEQTQIISVFLDPLRAKETVVLTAGAGTLVTSKNQYKSGVLVPSTEKTVPMIDIAHWGDAVNDSVRVPSTDYPICKIENAAIILRPITVASVDVYFIKKPTKPVYAFTTSSDDYVYSDIDSIDMEWTEELHDEIMNRVLANLGISQREGEVIQYSNIEQQKEGR
jgi:hypothetical protein